MNDIVNAGFIISHMEEILKLGDIIPKVIMKYIPDYEIEKYFKYNVKNNNFYEEITTVEQWKQSEELVLFADFPEDIIELLEDWVECYPQFEGILNYDAFDEYIEKDGEVVIEQPVEIKSIEKHLHDLIMERAGGLIEKYEGFPMPKLSYELANKFHETVDFPVPGMYGGFYYRLEIENGEYVLYVESWSRVVEGSGEAHRITKDKCELIAEGFV